MIDTICALATAPGGALGIIRVSGPQAFDAVSNISNVDCAAAAANTVHFTRLMAPSPAGTEQRETIDEALALTGALVVLSTRIIGHLAQSELAIDDVDVVNLAGNIATDERTILRGADHVAEPDVSHFAA